MRETQVWSPAKEDPLEGGITLQYSHLAIRWTKETGKLQAMSLQESDMTLQPKYHHTYFIFHKFVVWVLLVPYINERSVFQNVNPIAQDPTAC